MRDWVGLEPGVPCRHRNFRWLGKSQCELGEFVRIDSRESIRRKTPMFMMSERPARISSNVRFAISSAPKRDSQKSGVEFGNPEIMLGRDCVRGRF